MRNQYNVGQKIKGKLQKLKGNVELKTGNTAKGILDKTKGTLNEGLADIKTTIVNTSNE